MNKVKVSIDHNGVTYSAEINTIERTMLGTEDHGIFTAYLYCKGDGTGIGVGGYSLDGPPKDRDTGRIGSAFGMDWIMRVMQTVGVEKWEKLPGSKVLVLFDREGHWGLQAKGIANIDTGQALIFSELVDEARGRQDA